MTDGDILMFGPYFGSFEQEIITFRPYITWINEVLVSKKAYLCTHFNRQFLYKNIIKDDKYFLPVYKQFSRDEINQEGFIHNKVDQKDFNYFTKELKNKVCSIENCLKKEIDLHTLKYVKTPIVYSIYNKKFNSINIDKEDIPDELKGLKIFIPYGDDKKMYEIYKYLSEVFNFVLVGDMNSPLPDNNIILKYIDYFENGFKYIIGAITYSQVVVCPLSYWTVICNLQKVNVLSWGYNPGQFNEDGIYHFDNSNARILPDIDVKESVEDFLRAVDERRKQ